MNGEENVKSNSAGGFAPAPPVVVEKEEPFHPLAQMVLSEALSAFFKDRWIEDVEQAVGVLTAFPEEIEGKEQFLAQAKELLGEEMFVKWTTPAPSHPLGCVLSAPDESKELTRGMDEAEPMRGTDK